MGSKRRRADATVEVDPTQIVSSERRETGNPPASKSPPPPPPAKVKRRLATEEINPRQIVAAEDDRLDNDLDPGDTIEDLGQQRDEALEELDDNLPLSPGDELPEAPEVDATRDAYSEDFGAIDQALAVDEAAEAGVPSATAITSPTKAGEDSPSR